MGCKTCVPTAKACRALLTIFLVALGGQPEVQAEEESGTRPVAFWSFDDDTPAAVHDKASLVSDELNGTGTYAPGVIGRCLILDGLTTYVDRRASRVPGITGAFTVEAWIALGAYPLKWAPIVDLHDPGECGFFFGIDAHGRPGLALRADDAWQALTAHGSISLRQWHHLVGVFDPAKGMKLYVDGQPVAERKVEGKFEPPVGLDLLIGRHRYKAQPEGPIRPASTAEIFDFLDGAIDELKVYATALSSDEIARNFRETKVPQQVPLPPRVLPAGPAGPGPFGAFYTRLKFYPQWDANWRVSDLADVVVRFDSLPIRFVFWRGTSYVPHWVTENGIWYNNEFNETWTGVHGCGEPMSDKQCRYSHVRVIESTDARAVVHWRYALTDVFYTIARTDPATGLGDWTDEIHTIYPDGTAVRAINLHSSAPAEPHEWHEGIIVMGPGFSPEKALEPGGLTMANAAGESVTYSWKDGVPPGHPNKPENASIQLINTRSRFRPFAIVRPQDDPSFDIYAGEIRRDVSMYPWWNHWPAATFPSDGRYAMAADRTSHSSLTHMSWSAYKTGPQLMTKIMLTGMTDGPVERLVTLQRAWANPAPVKVQENNVWAARYDPAQKAYVLAKKAGQAGTATIEIDASAKSPLVNPALILKHWGDDSASVTLDGTALPPGPDCRIGRNRTLEGTDLVVWLRQESSRPVTVRVVPGAQDH